MALAGQKRIVAGHDFIVTYIVCDLSTILHES